MIAKEIRATPARFANDQIDCGQIPFPRVDLSVVDRQPDYGVDSIVRRDERSRAETFIRAQR